MMPGLPKSPLAAAQAVKGRTASRRSAPPMAVRALPSPSPFAFAPSALPFSATTTSTFAKAYCQAHLEWCHLLCHMRCNNYVLFTELTAQLIFRSTLTHGFHHHFKVTTSGSNTPHLCVTSCPLLALPSPRLPSRGTFPTLRYQHNCRRQRLCGCQLAKLASTHIARHRRPCSLAVLWTATFIDCNLFHGLQLHSDHRETAPTQRLLQQRSVGYEACNNNLLHTNCATPMVSQPSTYT